MDPHPAHPRPLGQPIVTSALLALAALLVGRFSFLGRHFELDDALIYRRYVANLLRGDGLVFNPGERFNALTSPLYSYLKIAASWLLGGEVRLATVLLGVALTGLTLAAFYLLLARFVPPVFAALGAVTTAASPYLYQTLGMETPLFLLLIGLCLLLADRPGTFWLGIASALLVLTRSEGIFLVLALAVRHLRRGRPWPPLRDFLVPAGLFAAVMALNLWYYGQPLPATAGVKIDQGRSGLWGEWPVFLRAGYHLDWFFGGSRILAAGVGSLALWGAWALRRGLLVSVGGWFLAMLLSFYLILNIPNYHWYCAPFYLFGFFFASAGLGDLARRAGERGPGLTRRVGLASVSLLAVALLAGLGKTTGAWLETSAVASPYRPIGEWLEERAAPDASLAVAEIGTVGWYSGLRVIDILGLVTPENSRFVGERRFGAWLEVYEPDYVLVHDPPWPVEGGVIEAAQEGRFARQTDFPFAGFRLYRAGEGEAGLPIAEQLELLRGDGSLSQRSRLARQILEQGLYDPIWIDGPHMQAVQLTADRWTRGAEPAALAVANPAQEPATRRLRLACVAELRDLPITVTLEAGDWRTEVRFEKGGFQQVDLPPLAPGEARLIVLWTDKAWTPGPHDPRPLGVKLFAPES
ncbi:MAG: hypothetical protein AAF725_05610 [Acidobacteriota bacterium]